MDSLCIITYVMHEDYARYQSCKRKIKQKINNNKKKTATTKNTTEQFRKDTRGCFYPYTILHHFKAGS